jgi:hypothetical protein
MEAIKELNRIQKVLKAPKGQFNKFGNYAYRSCEDILEAVKPHLGTSSLIVSDEIVLIGSRYYVKATAKLIAENGEYEASTAFAREPESAKGTSESQITGAASSYSRKYSLNGLFCIDDTKDDDFNNKHDKENKPVQKQQPQKTENKDYIIPFGKFAKLSLKDIADGKISDVCMEDIYKYVDYIESEAQKEKKPITGRVKEFIEEVLKYA